MNAASELSPFRLLVASTGLIIWALAFVLLYGGLSLGCEGGLHQDTIAGFNVLTLLLTAIWIIHVAAVVVLLVYARALRSRFDAAEPGRFLATLTYQIGWAGLVATVLTGVPVIFLPPCA